MGYAFTHFYGFNISGHFSRIQDIVGNTFKNQGISSGPGFYARWPGEFMLGDYLRKLGLGASEYDGNGDDGPQMTFIGVPVPQTSHGHVVSDEIVTEAEKIVESLLSPLKGAIIAAFGEIPKMRYEVVETFG